MLHAVIQERPEDPYDYMRRQMQLVCEQQNVEAGGPEKMEQEPATEEPKDPMEIKEFLEDTRKQLQNDIKSAIENGNLQRALKAEQEAEAAVPQAQSEAEANAAKKIQATLR